MRISSFSRLNFMRFIQYNSNGKPDSIFWSFAGYPKFEPQQDDTFYEIKEGDRPDLISYEYYKTTDLYWVILLANDISYWGDVSVGQTIRIPSYNYVSRMLKINSVV